MIGVPSHIPAAQTRISTLPKASKNLFKYTFQFTTSRDIHRIIRTIGSQPIHPFLHISEMFRADIHETQFRTLFFAYAKAMASPCRRRHRATFATSPLNDFMAPPISLFSFERTTDMFVALRSDRIKPYRERWCPFRSSASDQTGQTAASLTWMTKRIMLPAALGNEMTII